MADLTTIVASPQDRQWAVVETLQAKVASGKGDLSIVILAANALEWDLVEELLKKVQPTYTGLLSVQLRAARHEQWHLVNDIQHKLAPKPLDIRVLELAFASRKLSFLQLPTQSTDTSQHHVLAVGIDIEKKAETATRPSNTIIKLNSHQIKQPAEYITLKVLELEWCLKLTTESFLAIVEHPQLLYIFIGCYRAQYENSIKIILEINNQIFEHYYHKGVRNIFDLTWVTLKSLHDQQLLLQDAFEVPRVHLGRQQLHADLRYKFNTLKLTCFWFSTKSDSFLPAKQQKILREKAMHLSQFGIKCILGYSSTLLDKQQQLAIQTFADRFNISLLDIDEHISLDTNPLWQLVVDEITHIQHKTGGNPAALSDLCRMLPDLIPDGFYGDLDSSVKLELQGKFPPAVYGGAPILFNMGSIVSNPIAPRYNRQEAVSLNNDIIAYSGTPEDLAMRQNIGSYIADGYATPGSRVDLSPLEAIGIKNAESLTVFELRSLITIELEKGPNLKLLKLYKSLVEDITGPGAIYQALGGERTFTRIFRHNVMRPTTNARALQFFASSDSKSIIKSNNIPPWETPEDELAKMELNEEGLSWIPQRIVF